MAGIIGGMGADQLPLQRPGGGEATYETSGASGSHPQVAQASECLSSSSSSDSSYSSSDDGGPEPTDGNKVGERALDGLEAGTRGEPSTLPPADLVSRWRESHDLLDDQDFRYAFVDLAEAMSHGEEIAIQWSRLQGVPTTQKALDLVEREL